MNKLGNAALSRKLPAAMIASSIFLAQYVISKDDKDFRNGGNDLFIAILVLGRAHTAPTTVCLGRSEDQQQLRDGSLLALRIPGIQLGLSGLCRALSCLAGNAFLTDQ